MSCGDVVCRLVHRLSMLGCHYLSYKRVLVVCIKAELYWDVHIKQMGTGVSAKFSSCRKQVYDIGRLTLVSMHYETV